MRAAQKGWPVFVGVLGADLREQMATYRRALDAANHPQHVKDNCLRWCSYDWVGGTVAETEEKALEREKLARAETMAIRTSYVKRHGPTDGPAMKSASAQSRPEEYAKGGDWLARQREASLRRAREFSSARTARLTREVYSEAERRFLEKRLRSCDASSTGAKP